MEETDLDQMIEEYLKDPKVQRIVARAQQFDELRGHPTMKALSEEVERKEKIWVEQVAKKITAGVRIDHEAIERKRAFFAGAKWILAIPDQAASALETAAKKVVLIGALNDEQED